MWRDGRMCSRSGSSSACRSRGCSGAHQWNFHPRRFSLRLQTLPLLFFLFRLGGLLFLSPVSETPTVWQAQADVRPIRRVHERRGKLGISLALAVRRKRLRCSCGRQSIDAEEELYKAALKEGISCLTVSQRLSLPQFHDQELKVGENTASGYVLREITETENQLASAT